MHSQQGVYVHRYRGAVMDFTSIQRALWTSAQLSMICFRRGIFVPG